MIATLHRLSAPKTLFSNQHATAVEREFVRVVSGSGTIRDVSAVSAGPTNAPNLACGVKFQDGATDWIIQRAKMRGFVTYPRPGKKYINGDGFSSEIGNARLVFKSCEANENGDGGFDLKGPDWLMEDCAASRNGKNFRFWSSGKAKTIKSWHPKAVHFHICPAIVHTEQQVFDFTDLHATGPGIMLLVETRKGGIPPKIILGEIYATGVTSIIKVVGEKPDLIGL